MYSDSLYSDRLNVCTFIKLSAASKIAEGFCIMDEFEKDRPFGAMNKDITICSRSHGFDSWADQIGCSIANGSPSPHCFLGDVLPRR